MRITINNKELLRLLNNINFTLEKKKKSNIFGNLKICIEQNSISFCITDLKMFAKEKILISAKKRLTIAIPMHTFYKVIKKVNSKKDIELFFEPSCNPVQVFISNSFNRFMLPCFSAQEFPSFEEEKYNFKFQAFSKDLYYLFSSVKHAISTDEDKYYLNGLYIHVISNSNKEKKLRAVATDMHRLALGEINAPKNTEALSGIIIPINTILKLIKLLKIFEGIVFVKVSLKKVLFKIHRTIIISKLIDGKFPEYRLIVPDNKNLFKVIVEDLIEGVNLVKSISSLKNIVIKAQLKMNKLLISINERINFAAVTKVDINYIGPPISMLFNSQYLTDVLKNAFSKEIFFKFDSHNSPILILDDCKYNFKFILMPMQS